MPLAIFDMFWLGHRKMSPLHLSIPPVLPDTGHTLVGVTSSSLGVKATCIAYAGKVSLALIVAQCGHPRDSRLPFLVDHPSSLLLTTPKLGE